MIDSYNVPTPVGSLIASVFRSLRLRRFDASSSILLHRCVATELSCPLRRLMQCRSGVDGKRLSARTAVEQLFHPRQPVRVHSVCLAGHEMSAEALQATEFTAQIDNYNATATLAINGIPHPIVRSATTDPRIWSAQPALNFSCAGPYSINLTVVYLAHACADSFYISCFVGKCASATGCCNATTAATNTTAPDNRPVHCAVEDRYWHGKLARTALAIGALGVILSLWFATTRPCGVARARGVIFLVSFLLFCDEVYVLLLFGRLFSECNASDCRDSLLIGFVVLDLIGISFCTINVYLDFAGRSILGTSIKNTNYSSTIALTVIAFGIVCLRSASSQLAGDQMSSVFADTAILLLAAAFVVKPNDPFDADADINQSTLEWMLKSAVLGGAAGWLALLDVAFYLPVVWFSYYGAEETRPCNGRFLYAALVASGLAMVCGVADAMLSRRAYRKETVARLLDRQRWIPISEHQIALRMQGDALGLLFFPMLRIGFTLFRPAITVYGGKRTSSVQAAGGSVIGPFIDVASLLFSGGYVAGYVQSGDLREKSLSVVTSPRIPRQDL